MVRAAYAAMELTAWFVIVPLAVASSLTGIIQSLATPWRLFRHYWVLVKLLLTTFSTVVLLAKMSLIGYFARRTLETTSSSSDLHMLRLKLAVHAAGGMLSDLDRNAVRNGLFRGMRISLDAGNATFVAVTHISLYLNGHDFQNGH